MYVHLESHHCDLVVGRRDEGFCMYTSAIFSSVSGPSVFTWGPEHFAQVMKLPTRERELRKTRKLLTATSPSDCDYQYLELSATHELCEELNDCSRTDWIIPPCKGSLIKKVFKI